MPELRVPAWTKAKLSNGTELIVSEKHDLPLVSFSITFLGGSDQFETAERRGVGSLTASMMSEGTKTRNGDDLSNALQLLGTNVSVGVGSESGSISFVSTTAKFAATLDILADMLVNSTFPPEALERLRAQRLVALNQAKAQPGSIAGRVFPRVLYGDAHPLGQNSTEQTIKAITRADVVDFHQRYFKPGRALITVVGDITPAAIRPVIEKGLAGWAPGGEQAGILVSASSGGKGDDDLSRRQTRRRAVDVRHRPARPTSHHPRLLRAAGDEHDSGRHVPGAPQRQHPRGKGIQLRRQLGLRLRQGARTPSAPAETSSATRPTRPSWSS